MDAASIIKLGLRSRTLPGGIELFLVVFFGISFIAFLKSTYNRDSFTFEPETSSHSPNNSAMMSTLLQ